MPNQQVLKIINEIIDNWYKHDYQFDINEVHEYAVLGDNVLLVSVNVNITDPDKFKKFLKNNFKELQLQYLNNKTTSETEFELTQVLRLSPTTVMPTTKDGIKFDDESLVTEII